MQKALTAVNPGQVFTYGGIPWIKLDDIDGATLALTAESVFDRAFGENNNWATSSLRRELNEDFYETLLENGASGGAFLEMTVDLTADDGLDDYGTTTDKIALISCPQYRKYRKLIPNLDNWWWTVTPYSCESNGYSYSARYVYTDGTLSNRNAYYGNVGARPLCNLKSEILVSVDDAADAPESLESRVAALEKIVAELTAAR